MEFEKSEIPYPEPFLPFCSFFVLLIIFCRLKNIISNKSFYTSRDLSIMFVLKIRHILTGRSLPYLSYPFTAPAVIPSIKYLWKQINKIKIGIIENTDPTTRRL